MTSVGIAVFSFLDFLSLIFFATTSLVLPTLSISWTVICLSFFNAVPWGIPILAFLAATILLVKSTSTYLSSGNQILILSPASTSFGRFIVISLSSSYTSSTVGAVGANLSIITSFELSLSAFPFSVAVTVSLSPCFTVFVIENVPSVFAFVVAKTVPLLFFNLISEFAGAFPTITSLLVISS